MYRFSTFCVVDIQLCGVLWVGCIIKSDCFLKAFQRLLAYKFQSQIYKEQVEPLLKKSLEGYNVTLMAFGQTGSGKTHLLSGTVEDLGLVTMVKG